MLTFGFCSLTDGARPWEHVGKVDIALPSATQNEVSGGEAAKLIEAQCKYVAEGSNMGCSQDAIDTFEESRKRGNFIWYAPGKAANAGGVAVSGLEMAQNSQRLIWTKEEVDEKLKGIMEACFNNCISVSTTFPHCEGCADQADLFIRLRRNTSLPRAASFRL